MPDSSFQGGVVLPLGGWLPSNVPPKLQLLTISIASLFISRSPRLLLSKSRSIDSKTFRWPYPRDITPASIHLRVPPKKMCDVF